MARFQTDKLPFSWVGIEFVGFTVVPTAYTIGTSSHPTDPYPKSWEFQATADTAADWDSCTWLCLDKQLDGTFVPGSLPESSRTYVLVPCPNHRSYRRFRILQTAVNSQWGHELSVSGLEVYGNLFKVQY